MENIENNNDIQEKDNGNIVNVNASEFEDEEYELEENQYVIFRIDDKDFGIEIQHVHEIDRLKEVVINPVPKAPDYVEGIINLRGEVVPVLDLRKKLGLPVKEIGRETRILIVKMENKTIGLIVDMVLRVINIDSKEITITPEEISDVNTRFFSGIVRLEKRITLLLNINEVLRAEE
ncbi:MAG: chemotaxis protein CheW [Ignavibacteriales bacterium]